jgi:hypothetical protein
MATKALQPTETARSDRSSGLSLRNSAIRASVQDLAESLRQELIPKTALEKTAIEDYIQVECQRHSLRMIRDQLEHTYALGHIWTLLSRAMIAEADPSRCDTASLERTAELIVKRWSDGDADAWAEILLYGIDIDEAMSFGVATSLPQLAELERQRERLAQRARLLLDDIERAQTFVRKRKTVDILDAEVVA